MAAEGAWILHGPRRCGKTSALRRWCAGRDAGGVLTPDGSSGRRVLLDLVTGQEHAFEATPDRSDDECFVIGRFRLLRVAFETAAIHLRLALVEARPWIVIDEIGPLELQGSGFDPVLRAVLDQRRPGQRLLLVVRTELVDAVQERYGLGGCTIIGSGELDEVDS